MKNKFLIAIILFPCVAFSQRVDLDRFKFSTQYRSLPSVRLDSSYRTYNVTVETSRLMQPYVADMTPEKSVQLEGWKMLKKNGHIGIEIKLEELLPESFSVKEREEIIKDKTGKETGRRKLYSQEVVYTICFNNLSIVDQQFCSRRYINHSLKIFTMIYRNYVWSG